MSKSELKPCPFCGGEARAILVREVGWVYRIFCPKCRMSENLAFDKEKEELEKLIPKFIEKWNTRVYPKEVQETLEKQKPKKPKKDIVHYRCPNCDAMLNTYETCECCNHCGQKLDWSDYE